MILQFFEKYFVMILTAAIGTLGYCLNINVKRNKIVYGCVGGVVSTFLYCVCAEMGLSPLMQNFIPAAVVTLYAEALARVVKAPATVFLIPSIIPLVPGGRLYYTMRAIVDGDADGAKVYAMETIVIALGIAVGIVVISLVFYHISHKNIQYKVRFDAMGNRDQAEKEK
ncbi:MAG: threonine/serine exporter family protein [Lachnospiraceae bacterium]|nr:threonine/serine exporter family protein [Lachnospiraceae bacterium]MDE7185657.1 threonine/serine exporter family protein [Lachnospiraceae bacterium]